MMTKPEHFAFYEATNSTLAERKTVVACSGKSQTALKQSKKDPGLTRRWKALLSSESIHWFRNEFISVHYKKVTD